MPLLDAGGPSFLRSLWKHLLQSHWPKGASAFPLRAGAKRWHSPGGVTELATLSDDQKPAVRGNETRLLRAEPWTDVRADQSFWGLKGSLNEHIWNEDIAGWCGGAVVGIRGPQTTAPQPAVVNEVLLGHRPRRLHVKCVSCYNCRANSYNGDRTAHKAGNVHDLLLAGTSANLWLRRSHESGLVASRPPQALRGTRRPSLQHTWVHEGSDLPEGLAQGLAHGSTP